MALFFTDPQSVVLKNVPVPYVWKKPHGSFTFFDSLGDILVLSEAGGGAPAPRGTFKQPSISHPDTTSYNFLKGIVRTINRKYRYILCRKIAPYSVYFVAIYRNIESSVKSCFSEKSTFYG